MGREGADADAPWAWVLMSLEHLAVVDAIGDEVHPDFHRLGSTLYVGSPAPVPGLGRPLGNHPTEAFGLPDSCVFVRVETRSGSVETLRLAVSGRVLHRHVDVTDEHATSFAGLFARP